MKKPYQRGPQKSYLGFQNGDMGFPGSTYRLIFDVLLRCQKSSFLDAFPMDQKIAKIEPWSAKGKKVRHESSRGDFWDRGPRGRLARALYD
jgi:hypothetical protein